jgi:RNA polymerase sigma factor (sigma-70 family)
MNNRGPDLRLTSPHTFSGLSRPACETREAGFAMPANGPSHRLSLATTRDASGGDTSTTVGDTDRFAAMFLSNLEMVESVIRYVCQRHGLSTTEAEDLDSQVKLRLLENDYEIFRKFQQRSSLRTYLTIVIHRIYLDYRNHVWGKWRPSAEARHLGPVAIRLETLMGRDGLGFDQACEHLRINEGVIATETDLAEIAMRLPRKPRRALVGEEALEVIPVNADALDEVILSDERQMTAHRIRDALTSAVQKIDDQDRLILRLRFRDGLAIADIARALHLDQKPLYRRFDALLQQLRLALELAGIDRLEACTIVNRKDVDISLALLGGTRGADAFPEVPGPAGALGGSS